jgi:hypothetical protein
LFRWPLPLSTVWFLFPLAGVVLGASIQPISPHDYWWHLVMGRYISATGSIPDANLFLYTMDASARFLDQPWLSQLAMFELRAATGDVGLIWTRNILVAVTWAALLALALRRAGDARVVGIVAMVAVLLSGKTYGVRTQMFALVLFALLLWLIVEMSARRANWGWGLVLLPVTALWANVHGSFALVPVLVFACGVAQIFEAKLGDADAFEEARRWLPATAAALVGGSLTPHGVEVYAYVVQLSVFSTVAETVTEWQSPAWNTFYGAALLISVAAGVGVLAWRRRTVALWEVVLFAATAYLAADAIRSFYWFAAVFVVVLSPHVADLVRKSEPDSAATESQPTERAEEGAPVNAVIAAVLVMLPLAVQPASPVYERLVLMLSPDARQTPPGAVLHTADAPIGLANLLDQRGFEGRMFHAQPAGGLIEFVLAAPDGEQVAFVDQRMELIPESVWADYFQISRAEEGWQDLLSSYGIEAALLSLERQRRLVRAMEESEAWVRVADDEAHVMFVSAHSDQLTRWR